METREKQAYLIEAHKCDEMLLTLLRMLDVPWNDIFIHMDSKNTDYQPETVECRMKYAKVFHAKRHSVVWGGVSQVKAEACAIENSSGPWPVSALPPDLRCGSAHSNTRRYPCIF